MPRNIHVTQKPVILEGFQAILEPGKFGYSLSAIVENDVIDKLEDERLDCLKWCESRLDKPKRSVCKPEPWEEVSEGKYKLKFSWNDKTKPPVVDTEGSPISDSKTPLYGGSTVKLGFYQKPYILRDGITYGSSLKLVGVQVVSVKSAAGVDSGDLDDDAVAELFGKTQGFKTSDPNVVSTEEPDTEDDDNVDI